jgi:hypothetical protein
MMATLLLGYFTFIVPASFHTYQEARAVERVQCAGADVSWIEDGSDVDVGWVVVCQWEPETLRNAPF